jgi:hypothetical protein
MGFFFSSFKTLEYDWYYVFVDLCSNSTFWLTIILISSTIILKDIYFSGLIRTFRYKPYMVLQELEFRKGGYIPPDDVLAMKRAGDIELKQTVTN